MRTVNGFRQFASRTRKGMKENKDDIIWYVSYGLIILLVSGHTSFTCLAWDTFFDLQRYGSKSEASYALKMAFFQSGMLVGFLALLGLIMWLVILNERDSESTAVNQTTASPEKV